MAEQGDVAVPQVRSSTEVALAVWRALFLREAAARLTVGRAAWAWALLEPLMHVILLMAVFSVFRDRSMPGVEFALFLAIGVLGFHMFKNVAQRCIGAVEANQAMFTYRQVRPVDAGLVRCLLEGVMQVVVIVILLGCTYIAGFSVIPVDPLRFLAALFVLWFFGSGLGLVLSAGSRLVPEIGRVANLLFTPLYLTSGVFFRPEMAPPEYRDILLLNPIVHGIEGLRGAMFPAYHPLPAISLGYLGAAGVIAVFLGLALQVRLARRLAASS